MPLYNHHTFEEGELAIWKIEETPEELYALLGTDAYEQEYTRLHHKSRQAEWLAVRVLANKFLEGDAHITYLPNGKPRLNDNSYHISISHTTNYAALAWHRTREIGIDIERIASRVSRVAHRFTRDDEACYMEGNDLLMYQLLNWSAKETLFKLIGSAKVADFKASFHLLPYPMAPTGTINAQILTTPQLHTTVHYRLFPEFVCTCATL